MVRGLGIDRRGAEGAGRLPRTPRRTDHRVDDSNHPRPGHPVAHSRNPVAHTGTRPGGHNNQPVDQGSRRTGEAEHPGIGGSGLGLIGGRVHVGPAPSVPAVVAPAGAGTAVVAAAAEERAVDGARAAAAAGPAATAGTAVAAGKAAAAGTTAAAVGTPAADGTTAAAAGKAAAADTTAAAAGTSAPTGSAVAAAAAAVGAAAGAQSAAAESTGVAGAGCMARPAVV